MSLHKNEQTRSQKDVFIISKIYQMEAVNTTKNLNKFCGVTTTIQKLGYFIALHTTGIISIFCYYSLTNLP